MSYAKYRAIHIMEIAQGVVRAPTRKRVLMGKTKIGSTRMGPGVIINNKIVRAEFARREANQDLTLDREIARLDALLGEPHG